MKLGISAWRLYGQRLGIGRYIEYMLKHWNKMLEPTDRVTLFVHEPLDKNYLNLSDAFSVQVIKPKLTNALWENLLLPKYAKGQDVLFGPSYTVPLLYGGRSVVVIHSVDELQNGSHSVWHRFTYEQKYKLSVHKADKVIANSQSTRERVAKRYGISEDKIEPIWLGVDEAFRPIKDEDLLRSTRMRYLGADRPYILFVGGLSRRRNIPTLMTAFSILKNREKIPHSLLLVGPNRARIPLEKLAKELGIAGSFVQTDGLFKEHRELASIYNAADIFVLPSSSEGFSLTLPEAMSCGTPVITVNCSTLAEIANGYGFMIEEPSVEALTKAMYKVLDDSELRKNLSAKCLERARSFRWEITARRTLEVLRNVAQT